MKDANEMKEHYDSYVNCQKQGYELSAKMIGYIIERMQQEGIISKKIEVTGRIKSFQSAYENNGKKSLDDCFGIRIIGKEEELKKIKEEIEKIMIVNKIKDHRKSHNTKYKAIHQLVYMDEKYTKGSQINYDLFPLIEIQYWSDEMERLCIHGELSYANYKKSDFKKILTAYWEDEEAAIAKLPIYYEIKGRKIRQLSGGETLFKLYPEIGKTKDKKEENEYVSR